MFITGRDPTDCQLPTDFRHRTHNMEQSLPTTHCICYTFFMAEFMNMAIVCAGYMGLATTVALAHHRVIGANNGPQSLVLHMDSGVDV